MREYFNDEQSCQEKREEEQFAAFMEEQMQKEAEQIEEELKRILRLPDCLLVTAQRRDCTRG